MKNSSKQIIFKIRYGGSIDSFPVPIIESQTNIDELINFVMELPDRIFEENKNKINGVVHIH